MHVTNFCFSSSLCKIRDDTEAQPTAQMVLFAPNIDTWGGGSTHHGATPQLVEAFSHLGAGDCANSCPQIRAGQALRGSFAESTVV